jgi:group I intron endonuclease
MVSYVYLITNTINEKLYVGKSNNPNKRWNAHKQTARSGPADTKYSYLHKAIKKYGSDNFMLEIIDSFPNEELAFAAERNCITFYLMTGFKLYNLTAGGEGSSGYKHSAESKKKFSGENNPNFGKPMSGLRKERFKFSAKGSAHPLFGRAVSEETKNKISTIKTNSPNKPSKLTWNDVGRIRELYDQRISATEIARGYPQVHENTVFHICSGRTWKIK